MMNGRSGLIGHTGFVGGTLDRAMTFDARYNSSNVDALRGEAFDLLVCAGVSAVKWQANKHPEADRAGIARLTDALAEVTARELVLISTIDVYPDPASGADEATAIDPARNHAYGRHRLELEHWVTQRFPCVRIVRLPALFGTGLRKNALYDLLHANMLDSINPAGVFQWYPTARLADDIAITRRENLDLVNLFPEALGMARLIDSCFPGAAVGAPREPAPRYDLRTRHASHFGGTGHHIMTAEQVLNAIGTFVAEARAA